MKRFIFLTLLSVLFVSPYALAQVTSCPCDDLELSNGNTGAEIVGILCPGGSLAAGINSIVDPNLVEIIRSGGEKLELGYAVFIEGGTMACEIFEETIGEDGTKLSDEEYEFCRASLIARCKLLNRNIPTLSEWGMIAMAGVLGMIGLYVASRRRKATA